jgi:hypothetical protein
MYSFISFESINWVSVLAATIIAFGIGGLWYSKLLFGDTWLKELKINTEEYGKPNMPKIFGGSFVLLFIGNALLAAHLGNNADASSGLVAGLVISIAWISTAIGTNYLFARKSLKLFIIDSGYFVVLFSIAGLILGAWQ